VRHEFGTHVAFFPGPTRGEFHFRSVEDLAVVSGWPARGAAVDRTIVLALTPSRRAERTCRATSTTFHHSCSTTAVVVRL
jgi:hypothetical protein